MLGGPRLHGDPLNVQNGIFDRLSVQEMNSCETAVIGLGGRDGGWLNDLQNFYSAAGRSARGPPSNPGASWQDGGARVRHALRQHHHDPQHRCHSITANSISTYGVSQAQAIANIKSHPEPEQTGRVCLFPGHAKRLEHLL